jgi:predicted AAA+ superfamily ATPase
MAIPTVEDMKAYNPWIEGRRFDTPAFKREAYEIIFNAVKKRKFIVAVTGLRRIGKTTLIKQIGNEIEGDRFFFSFEEDVYANYDSLKSVVEYFIRIGERPVIFLDEISRVEGWAGLLKKYHDLGKASFVVSGSASLGISKGKESLAGRLMEFNLEPWSFKEFLAIKGTKIPKVELSDLERSYLRWRPQGHLLPEFLKKGGFPELYEIAEPELIRKYIKSTSVEKIIFEDIPKTFMVEEKGKLYDIMEYVAKESGNILVLSHLGDALELSKDTTRKYLLYLQYAYLINILSVEGSTLKSFKKPKKAYASTSAICYGVDPNIEESRLVETAVYQKLRELTSTVFFYRDPAKREVDFTGDFTVEVKWKDKVLSSDMDNLVYYLRKKNKKSGFLINKNEFAVKEIKGKTIYFLPLDFFLCL